MICSNCGNQIPDNSAFCGNCGAKCEPQNTAAMNRQNLPIEETNGSAAEFSSPSEAPVTPALESIEEADCTNKKKSLKPLLLIGGGVLVLAVLILTFFSNLKGYYYKTIASPEDYLGFVANKGISDFFDNIAPYGNNAGSSSKTPAAELRTEIELSEQALSFIKNIIDTDVEWLNNAAINIKSSQDKQRTQTTASLELSGINVLDFSGIFDYQNNKSYFTMDNLTDQYLSFDHDSENASSLLSIFADDEVIKLFPSEKDLSKILLKYIDISIRNLNQVSKSEHMLQVGEIEQKTTKLTLNVDNKTVLNVSKAVLSELKEDKDIKKYVLDFGKYFSESKLIDMTGDEFYKNFIESLDEALAALDEEEANDEVLFTVHFFISNSHECTGFEIEMDGDTPVFFKKANDGKNFATHVVLGNVALEGKGTITAKETKGAYTVFAENEPVFELTADFEIESLSKGILEGKFEIVPTEHLFELAGVPSSATTIISMLDLTLALEFDYQKDHESIDIDFLSKDESLFSIDTEAKLVDESKVIIPRDENVIDSENAEKWAESLDLEKLIQNLEKASLPKEIIESVKSSLGAS